MKGNRAMGAIPHDEVGRWSAADRDVLRELKRAASSFPPEASLPVIVAGTFAPRGPVVFRRSLSVLAVALGQAVTEMGADAGTVAKVVGKFVAETEAGARLLWLDSVGPGTAVSAMH